MNVEIAAYIAGGMFNEGYSAVLKTMQLLDLKIGQQCNNFAKGVDKERVTRQHRRDSFSSKEARTARRLEHQGENQFFEESEGQLYGPGIAD
ncbi:unnamed protein product [Arctia plantaginis]|uniref:Uncharacterized protein n=1 Tax=Arctia plantaginis TaxID=874455 RepID=A0A8S0Z9S0_ARCPL|nr:unnamed protein product [Arctia plantaginis]